MDSDHTYVNDDPSVAAAPPVVVTPPSVVVVPPSVVVDRSEAKERQRLMPSEAETPEATCGPDPAVAVDPPAVVDPPSVVVDRSEASEARASLSEAETPVAACGAAEDPAPNVADPADPVALWLASDSARELDSDLGEAFGHLQRGFEMLLSMGQDGELGALGPDRLIAMAKRLEAHRTRLVLIDSHVIEAASEERIHEHVCVSTIALALAQTLHISRGEAAARVARATQLIPRNGFSSGAFAPELPVLAEAVRDGRGLSVDQVGVIGKALKRLATNSDLTIEQRELAEQLLVHQAAGLTHQELASAAEHIDEVINPDGAVPNEHVAHARRGVTIGPLAGDGTHRLSGYLTREAKALFDAAIGPLAAPRPADDAVGADERSAAQRTHDALHDSCQRLLDSAGVPASGGTAATVHITIDLDQLTEAIARLHDDTAGRCAQRAAGRVAGGDTLTIEELLRLAREAVLIPVWISSTHGILGYGRERRTATPAQTHALIARDGGCSFPGCTAPPDWCQRHHVIAWWRGGDTDIDNLTLVCGYHHREFDKRGWSVDIINGIPVWTPPRWIDPEQKPQINARIKIPDQQHIAQLADAVTRTREAREAREGQTAGGGLPVDPAGLLGTLLDPADDVDELIQLIATQVPDERRDDFYRDAAGLLSDYLTTAADAVPAARASGVRGPAMSASTR